MLSLLKRLIISIIVLTVISGVATGATPSVYAALLPSAGPSLAEPDRTPAAGPLEGTSRVAALNLTGLKAVLVVGPVPEDPTYSAYANSMMNTIADEFAANGVAVHKFYSPAANWSQIKAAAQGAHFFIYYGHGLAWGGSPPLVGGLRLDSGSVHPDTIRNELRLAPKAIVMIGGCYAAGTGPSEYRTVDIGVAEAQRRATQYFDPFLQAGAGAYYGCSYGWNSTFLNYVRFLFDGQSLGEAYQSFGDFNLNTVTYSTHPTRPELALWIDKDFDRVWIYNQAFIGRPAQTLDDLFGPTVQPPAVAFLAVPGSPPQQSSVHIGVDEGVNWTAILTPTVPSWASISLPTGVGPQDVVVEANPAGLSELGVYQAVLQVTFSEPGATQEQETVPVTLSLTDQIHSVFLPMISR